MAKAGAGRRGRVAKVPAAKKPSKRVPQYMVVIYGQGGAGKTSLFGTLERLGRGLVIDTPQYEGGTEVIAQHRKFIDVREARTWTDIEALYHAVRTGKATFEDGGEPYQWVGIDTGTGVQKIARRKVKADEDDEEMRRIGQAYKLTLPNYGSIGDLMAIFFEDFRNLRIPVIIMCQEREREDEETGAMVVGPDLTPMSLREVVPHPKLLGRLYVARNGKGQWERRLRVGVHPGYYTKVRAVQGRRLPAIIKRPHLGDILAYMSGEDIPKPRAARDDGGGGGDLELE